MRTSRNILIIVQNLPVPFDRRVWMEATSLRRQGFGVAVVCPKKGRCTASYERLEDVDIFRYPLVYEASKGVAGYFVEFVYCWLASLWLALKAYAHRPFHAIHACNPPDTFFALALLFRPLGVKFVFDHHDLCPEMYVAKGRPRTGLLYRGLVMLERLTLRTADAVIAVNESHRMIARERGGISDDKISVVRSGPRRGWAEIHAPSPELKRGHANMVLYLGEMCEQDGLVHLLHAIETYRAIAGDDTLFAFVGGGPDQPRMKAMAEEMGLGPVVHFTGRIDDEQLWAYLSTADVCVDPDPLTEWSNMSTMNKIIEYMAFGRPIVAFDLAENRRSAESAAVYVQGNDDAALGRAIHNLLLNAEQREAMSQFGRARFREALAWENSEQRLIATYRQLLDFPVPAFASASAD
ncbi:MAG TPA: glycosyltransferase family 4 protein [Candidatus Acidoferrales bacterium]|jgi:glycosyltransferase involved in cell wall biosynthesis|nr:glycosyltransferase family 4 protein [Candidatus Acidoferrales bacterium]